jgi:hypothetical protein
MDMPTRIYDFFAFLIHHLHLMQLHLKFLYIFYIPILLLFQLFYLHRQFLMTFLPIGPDLHSPYSLEAPASIFHHTSITCNVTSTHPPLVLVGCMDLPLLLDPQLSVSLLEIPQEYFCMHIILRKHAVISTSM